MYSARLRHDWCNIFTHFDRADTGQLILGRFYCGPGKFSEEFRLKFGTFKYVLMYLGCFNGYNGLYAPSVLWAFCHNCV